MTQLKTLKDFEIDIMDQFDGEPPIHKKLIDGYSLKQEAIKWIKEIALADKIDLSRIEFEAEDNEHYDITYRREFYTDEGDKAVAQIGWIMHFFNITDKEVEEFHNET